MRKIFFLIPALFLAMMVNAKEIEISSSTSNIIYSTINASTTVDGDVIVLTDAGPYVNAYGVDYTWLRKSVTIKAAQNVKPVIKFVVPFRMADAASVKFEGIKFDGSNLKADVGYSYYFRVNSNEDNCLEFENCEFTGTDRYMVYVHDGYKAKSLKFENCEFYGNTNYIITGSSSSHVDICEINNCYFHDNTWNPIYFVASSVENQQTCSNLKVTNSTFANIDCTPEYRSVIDIKPYGSEITDAIKVVVDHCTFYNNLTISSDHSAIRPYKLSDVTISNCIFAHGSSYERRATCCWGGSVSNCLTYNLTKDTDKHGHGKYGGDMTLAHNVTADPQFKDAANDDYSFLNNSWEPKNLSPACGAGTDGLDLGDPRWHTTLPVLPSVDFSSAYDLVGSTAQLTGDIELNSNNISYNGSSVPGVTSWRMNVTKACAVKVDVNMADGSDSGCRLELVVFDEEGNKVDAVQAEYVDDDTDFSILGTLYFPQPGKYIIRLNNGIGWSSAKIEAITLTYAGGAVQNLPCTTAINEAWYGNGGTRENGAISYSSWNTENSFVKWNAATTSNIFCNVILNVSVTTAHHFFVYLYEQGQEEPFATLSENYTEYGGVQDLNINLGKIYIASGKNLMIKVTNPVSGGEADVKSVQFSEVAIPTIDIPGTLNPADAMLSEKARIVNDSLLFADYGQEGYNEDQWAKWKISVSERAYYKFTLNARNQYEGNGHRYTISVLSNDESQVIATKTSAWTSAAEATAEVYAELTPGNYIVKAQNPLWGSKGRLMNIISTREGGAFTELPGQLLGNEAMLHATKLTRDANNDIVYGDNDQPRDEFVMWNVNATEAVELVVTLNLDADNTSGHNYVVELCQNGVKIDSVEEASGTNFNPGIIEITAKNLNIPAAGDYTIKLINRMKNSANILHGITFVEYVAPEPVVIDENATENGEWATYLDGDPIDLSISRTLKGGVYNTICLPFELGSTGSMSAAFGAGYELLRLKEATLEGGVLNLIFEEKETMESGVPYLIKPVADVKNPNFTGRKIKKTTASTETKGNVQFIGTFVKQTIDQDEHNLYLGNDNSLYFVNNDVTIKGMRGYFHLNIQNPQQVIRRAQIVAGSQVVTSVDFVKDANNATFKTIENGQLVIIRDGIRYNVMGVKIQ